MGKLTLVLVTSTAAMLGIARPSLAQPAPSPVLLPAAAASPEAAPPVSPPSEPASAEEAAPEPAPITRRASPAATLARVAFNPLQQGEAPPAAKPMKRGRLNVGTALGLSLGGTLATWGLIAGGIATESAPVAITGMVGTFLAPNLGHWYQGKLVTLGTGARALAGLGMFVGLGILNDCHDYCGEEEEASRNERVAVALLIGGGIIYIGGTIYDVVDAPLEANKHNRRIKALGIAPLMTNGATGLALGGRF